MAHRIVTATRAGVSASYRYDADDLRTAKTINGATIYTLWAGDIEASEIDGAGALARRYVPGPAVDDRVATVQASGVVTFNHADRQGNVIAASNIAGQAIATSAYSANGEFPVGQLPAGGSFGYTGRQFDPETGLYYYRARYYNPVLGQFLQADQLAQRTDQAVIFTSAATR